jgi:hypothetical protein
MYCKKDSRERHSNEDTRLLHNKRILILFCKHFCDLIGLFPQNHKKKSRLDHLHTRNYHTY